VTLIPSPLSRCWVTRNRCCALSFSVKARKHRSGSKGQTLRIFLRNSSSVA
jgi:hypothetical protein